MSYGSFTLHGNGTGNGTGKTGDNVSGSFPFLRPGVNTSV